VIIFKCTIINFLSIEVKHAATLYLFTVIANQLTEEFERTVSVH